MTPYSINAEDKVVAITGGYGHLGKAATESLLHHGGTVYVLARDEEKFVKAFGEHALFRKKLFFVGCDVADTSSIKSAFRQIVKEQGRLDVLVNNAIFSKGRAPIDLTDDEWSTGIDGVLSSVFRCIREVVPHLRQSRGSIINVSSMYGIIAPDFNIYEGSPQYLNPPHYGTAKAGVLQLTRYYASLLGAEGITVNAVTPGAFPRAGIQEDEVFVRHLKAKAPLRRIGRPEDLAGAFVFLASDAARFITGQNIIVDGGWTSV